MHKSPCYRDCPERNAECHTTCEKYKQYKDKCNAEMEKRMKQTAATPDPTPIVIRALKRRNKQWKTNKQRLKKPQKR